MSDVKVEFRDGQLRGFIFFDTWAKAMNFISRMERRERLNPNGRYAHVVF